MTGNAPGAPGGRNRWPPLGRRRSWPLTAWLRARRQILAAELSHGGWLNFGQLRWSDANVLGGLRAGIGVIVPLVLGLVTGHMEYGAFAALGALPAGFVSFQGFSRTRLTAVVLAAVGMAMATFAGAAAADANGWWLVPTVAVVCYLSGLLVALGQRLTVAGVQVPIALLIASGIPLSPSDAALRAILVLAGGLWQAALVVASWAFLPGGQERSAVAAAYRALGAYAAQHPGRPAGARAVPPTAAFGAEVLQDPNPLMRTQDRECLMLMLEEGERIRSSLAALARYGSGSGVLEPAAQLLDGMADALEARRGRREQASALAEALAAIDLPRDAPWRWAGAGLLGEMRAAVRLLGRLGQDSGQSAPDTGAGGPRRAAWRTELAAALFTLRASAGRSTEAGQHALRLAAIVAIGEIIALASGLPHGYWIPLTIALVVRPDYASTIYRGVQRAAGTIIGAGLGLATALLLHAGMAVLVAAAGVTMTIAYAIFAVNYLLYAVFLTDFVVVLLALLGQTAEQTAVTRLIGTGIGGALAVIGYLAWPSWGGEQAKDQIARLYQTQGRYASLALRAYARPGRVDASVARSAQLAARRARADAGTAAARLSDEPPRPPMTARLAYALTDTARRMAYASLTLQAALNTPRAGSDGRTAAGARADSEAAVDRFADSVEAAATAIAGSLRSLQPPADLPPLRKMQTAVYNQLNGSGREAGELAGPGSVLIACTDEYTDVLDTASDLLRQGLGVPSP